MPSFGIIAEGVTDQIVLENILRGYLATDAEESRFRYLQPPDDTTQASQPAPGGWGPALNFLRDGGHQEVLSFIDYLVVHIDTDVSQEKAFDVPWREAERELSVEELVARVVDRLQEIMGREFCTAHGDRIIFAIAVHQIECWMLPLFFEDKRQKAQKITGCLDAVNDARRKQNKLPLKKGDHKQPRVYDEVSREYARPRSLMKLYGLNPSLKIFIEGLDAMKLRVPAEGSSPEQG